MSDLTVRFNALKDDDAIVLEKVAAIRNSVAEVTVADDYLIKAAKFEIALTDFWNENKLSAMAVQCWATTRIDVSHLGVLQLWPYDRAGHAHGLRGRMCMGRLPC